jgi:pyruvate decarboxylase
LSSWLNPHDIILTESGTASLGIWDTSFPSNVRSISQTIWGSIGFALPAAQGAATAAREMKGHRVILFVGDGSFQVTAQALGTMVANKLNVIIFLINNSGYTMERWVHGMEAHYNDIPDWRYTDIPLAFGGSEETVKTYSVNTKTDLEALLADKSFQAGKGVHFVDMRMPKEDAPLTLRMLCTSAAKSNTGHIQ